MGPDNQNNFPNNSSGNNMPVMGPPQPTPEPQQPVMGVPQPVPDVQPAQPELVKPEPAQPEPAQPELAQFELTKPVQTEPVLPVRSETPQPTPEQPLPTQPGASVENPMTGLKSKKNLIIIGVIAGVVVVALIIAIIVIMNSGKKSSQPLNPEYNNEVTGPDENGDISGGGEEENVELSADAKRIEDYKSIIIAVNSFIAANDGELSRLVQTKDPASLNPAKWVNSTGEGPDGNNYELRAYSFNKWQSEGDLAPVISPTTNGSQVFVVVGATCSGVDANGNFQPAMSNNDKIFAVYGHLEEGVFCMDSVAAADEPAPTNDGFDF